MLPGSAGGSAAPDLRSGVSARVLEVNANGQTITRGTAFELWEFRHVLTAFVAREIKVRYKQTAIGIGWAFLQPVLAAAIFAVFLGRVAHVTSEGLPYLLFALAGTVVWTYFSSALNLAAQSVVQNQMLVRKIFFPREILPLYAVLATIVDLVPGLVVLAVVAAYYDVYPSATWLLLPIPVLIGALAAAGFGIILAAINVYYRDVRYALPFVLQIGLFASPVVYSLSSLSARTRTVYGILNPVAAAIDGVRRVVLHHEAPIWSLTLGALAWSFILAAGGYILFKRLERSFADRL